MSKHILKVNIVKAWLHGVPEDRLSQGINVAVREIDLSGNVTLSIKSDEPGLKEIIDMTKAGHEIPQMLLVAWEDKNAVLENIYILMKVGVSVGKDEGKNYVFILKPKKIVITTNKGVHLNPGPPSPVPPINRDGNTGWYFFDDALDATPHAIRNCNHFYDKFSGDLTLSSDDIDKVINSLEGSPELYVLVLPDKEINKYVEYKFHSPEIIKYVANGNGSGKANIGGRIVERII